MSSGPSPAPVLVVALVVLFGGIAALATHDDRPASAPSSSSSHPASTSSSAGTSSSATTARPSSSTASTTSIVATSVRPAVGSPEAAANGLWAAYTAANRAAAQRFATDDVIRVLFQVEYSGEQGTFQSCRPEPDGFACRYTQPSAQYAMTVRADPSGSFKVVEITVTSGS